MGSDEDRSANLAARSHLASCSRSCGLTGSIVPARGPAPGVWCLSARTRDFPFFYALAAALPATNSVPSASIRCKTTASFRASATFALRMPARLATRIAQLFSDEPFTGLVRMTLAASYSAVRTLASPILKSAR